jgi:hypothetical protein
MFSLSCSNWHKNIDKQKFVLRGLHWKMEQPRLILLIFSWSHPLWVDSHFLNYALIDFCLTIPIDESYRRRQRRSVTRISLTFTPRTPNRKTVESYSHWRWFAFWTTFPFRTEVIRWRLAKLRCRSKRHQRFSILFVTSSKAWKSRPTAAHRQVCQILGWTEPTRRCSQ